MKFQIKPNIRVEIIRPDIVYLLGERGNHVLTGKLYYLIVPFLDGTNTSEDIFMKLEEKVPLEYIEYVLSRLWDSGHLLEAPIQLDETTASFWCESGIHPISASNALNKCVTIESIGTPLLKEHTIALGKLLMRLGIRVITDSILEPDLRIVCVDDYLNPDLDLINSECLKKGAKWMLLKPIGTLSWIGPVFVPGINGCWKCISHRIEGNREVARSIAFQKQFSKPTGRAVEGSEHSSLESVWRYPVYISSLPTTIGLALNFAATEIAKYLVNVSNDSCIISACSESSIMTFDHVQSHLATHHFSARPQCSACGDVSIMAKISQTPVRLERRQKISELENGHRVMAPIDTLNRYHHLVSPITGVVSQLERISDPHNNLVHTYKASHAFSKATTLRGLRNMLLHKSSGKGKTDVESKVSALCEALERYSGIYQGDEGRVTATLDELGHLGIDPKACLCISESQYDKRELINRSNKPGHDWIPMRFDRSQRIDWSPAWSLSERVIKYLPSALCYYDYPISRDHYFCRPDSNGCAAGNSLEEAILQGFLELVERDCVALWWFNKLQRPLLDLSSFGNKYFDDLVNYYKDINRDVWALDITSDLGIPCVAAISRRIDGASERIILGFGAHLDPTIAVLRALTELNQLGLELDKIPDESVTGDARDWLLSATIESNNYLLPKIDQSPQTIYSLNNLSLNDIHDEVYLCVGLAERAGLETLVLNQTRPDIGLNVVRVVIPGLRHFWSRLAPGRLYDVPVKMGWISRPTPEEEMNVISMPF